MRQLVIDLLNASTPPYPVYSTRVEKLEGSAISVQNVANVQNLKASTTFSNSTQFSVVIKVVHPVNYDVLLDQAVSWATLAILENSSFLQEFNITSVKTAFDYGQAGEQNHGIASITFTAENQIEYEPNDLVNLHEIRTAIDFISPISRKELFVNNPEDYLKKPDGVTDFELQTIYPG